LTRETEYAKKNISRFDELMKKSVFNNNQGSNREALWNDYPYFNENKNIFKNNQ